MEPTAVGTVTEGGRPRVVLHVQTSVDGRVAVSPGVLLMGDDRWPRLGDPYADVRERHAPDALLEGAGSFLTDDAVVEPLPAPPDDVVGGLRRHHLPGEVVRQDGRRWLVVTDSRGRLRWPFTEYPEPGWEGWHVLALVTTTTTPSYLAFLHERGVPYLVAGDGRVHLGRALVALREELDVRTVVATAGGRLSGALLRAGVVDEVEVDVLPMAVGGTATPSLFAGPDLGPADRPVGLELLDVHERGDGRVLLRYAVRR